MNSEASENKVVLDGNGSPSVTLTIRLIMQGKEVGSIIGKKGDNIKKFREESGAKINISDGSCPERIVTVTGATECILKAFALIASKFEEDIYAPAAAQQLTTGPQGNTQQKPQVTLRLVVPASQCGSLIGKGGAKIKEIREMTGATIQVASEMLPNSTERAVTISGNSDAITKCIYQICCVMMESPPKGATIPFRPKPAMPPVIFAGGQAYTIQGQYAIPHPDLTKLHQLALQHAPLVPGQTTTGQTGHHHQQAQNQHHAASVAAAYHAAGLSPQAAALANLAAANPAQQPMMGPSSGQITQTGVSGGPNSTSELSIPNELIGCIIGKGGAKINEIRQLSGATIKISNTEEGSKDRTVVIAGTPESINLAQYLINTSMELHKNLTLDPSTAASMNLNLNPNPSSMSSMLLPNISVASSLASNNSSSTSVLSSSSGLPMAMSLSHLVPQGVLSTDNVSSNPCVVSSTALNPSMSVHSLSVNSNMHHSQNTHLNQLLNPNSNNNNPTSTSQLTFSAASAAALAAAQSLFSNASSSSEVLSSNPHQHLTQQLQQQQQSLFQSQYNLNAFSTNMSRVKSNLVTKVRAGPSSGMSGVHASLLSLAENGNSTKTKADRKFAPY